MLLVNQHRDSKVPFTYLLSNANVIKSTYSLIAFITPTYTYISHIAAHINAVLGSVYIKDGQTSSGCVDEPDEDKEALETNSSGREAHKAGININDGILRWVQRWGEIQAWIIMCSRHKFITAYAGTDLRKTALLEQNCDCFRQSHGSNTESRCTDK